MNNITIEFCTEDRARIDRLTAALENRSCDKCVSTAIDAMHAQQNVSTAEPVQQHAIPYAPVATPTQPVQQMAPQAPVQPVTATATLVVPIQPTNPTMPNAVIPTGTVAYDMDTIARAGSALIDQNPANIDKLMELLAKYGTNAITTLAKEHYGAFVTDLRALGAPI